MRQIQLALVALGFVMCAGYAEASFPTSKEAARGTPWTHMAKNGYTGGFEKACDLLKLSLERCKTYQKMHREGTCRMEEVPNGTVLNKLTYTRGGKHTVQNNVLVALKDPSTRTTEVCDLGGGVYAMRFLGCGNHGLVMGKPIPRTARVPEVVVPPMSSGCPGGRKYVFFVWGPEAKRLSCVQKARAEALSSPDFHAKDRVSRMCNDDLLAAYQRGNIHLYTKPVTITMARMKQHAVTGASGKSYTAAGKLSIPYTPMKNDETDNFVYTSSGTIFSPINTNTGMHQNVVFPEEPRWCENNIHAIIE